MLTSNVGLALAGLTAWGLYGYLFSRESRGVPRPPPSADDRALCGAIHAAVRGARVASNPRAIHCRVENGYVTLSGDVFWSEANAVMSVVRALPRVKGVRNRLRLHQTATGVASLQGRPFPASPPT